MVIAPLSLHGLRESLTARDKTTSLFAQRRFSAARRDFSSVFSLLDSSAVHRSFCRRLGISLDDSETPQYHHSGVLLMGVSQLQRSGETSLSYPHPVSKNT